ncbi:MAG: hypothetical protein PHU49_13060 [Syntrophorhabdaceae bacterium]|nr:hypothetical protein [Syntrophorhabdaceae bacterium]MDD5244937.1 hypothetical protein [Syntrophorhabdaceae bacterium]
MKIYKTYFTPEFLKQSKKYRHLKKTLKNKIMLLSKNPYTYCKSELLIGELKGLRSARITKSFRVIFSVCEECRARKFKSFVGCSQKICMKTDSNTIIFFTFGPHEEVYS